MSRARAICLLTLGVFVFTLACGDDSGDGPGAEGIAPKRVEGTDSPEGLAQPTRTSAIRAVPVVGSAVAEPSMSGPGREVYRLSLPAALASQWYQSRMPDGEPFNGLAWCARRDSTAPSVHESSWMVPGTKDFLVVQVSESDQGTFLTVLDEKGNSTRTCG